MYRHNYIQELPPALGGHSAHDFFPSKSWEHFSYSLLLRGSKLLRNSCYFPPREEAVIAYYFLLEMETWLGSYVRENVFPSCSLCIFHWKASSVLDWPFLTLKCFWWKKILLSKNFTRVLSKFSTYFFWLCFGGHLLQSKCGAAAGQQREVVLKRGRKAWTASPAQPPPVTTQWLAFRPAAALHWKEIKIITKLICSVMCGWAPV